MQPNVPTIYLIPTVLAADTASGVLPAEVSEVIKNIDIFFVENLRTARRFISSLRLGKVIDQLEFWELDKKTPSQITWERLQNLKGSAGIISEAGCPGVADPGAVAVEMAHQLGYTVKPLVGPSSILLALMGSGMNGQSFAFHGYLPIDKAERKTVIKQLEKESAQRGQTQIFMETPFRNNQLLAAILDTAAPNSRLCIASNLTAPDEFIRTMAVKDWKKNVPELHKQPTIFLLSTY
ncbi:16S rRNA (cytidine1402-2'-O)-methyltransferase [Dyadobacter jejuensis]|uniref:16S rRNA (Cytidine1402-2'-O)-methyltransferase n=1 Tax=Dyadobacter jejuensis TaxID=1082580 RepID=A0A316AMJ6_9BACT|nr:SAM-dependent methyltransferase [Dyadobacter jejuensis]PWJ58762.1 16S rRNA (cytidine1402-2'-O)-methyltransferase [Dyadobacter jejuensis]